MNNIAKILKETLPEQSCYVGGCLRDSILKRPSGDVDIALPKENIKKYALTLAKKLSATAFEMDAKFGVWRLITKKGNLQIDLTAFQGKDLKQDLQRRDFTINALAYPVSAQPEIKLLTETSKTFVRITKLKNKEIIDLATSVKDIKNKTVKMSNNKVFKEDPLRSLRAFRTATELGFKIDKKTLEQIKKDAKQINKSAGERIREELVRIFNQNNTKKHLEDMDRCGLLTALFPILEDQRRCAEVYYGKGGVLKHTLLVVDAAEYLLNNTKKVFPKYHKKLEKFTKDKTLYKMAALLHDVAKPATAKEMEGRLRFFFHEAVGAKIAEDILKKLRYSTAQTRMICAMIREHLRPSNLASNDVLTDKAVYKFFRDMGEAGVPMLLLCWSDYCSYITRNQLFKILPLTTKPVMTIDESKEKGNVSKTLRHMQVVNHLFKKYFEQTPKINPPKIIDGKEIMTALKIKPGPVIGEILEAVALAQVEGKVKNKSDAVKFIKTLKIKS
ncbi:Metal-dependent phosphohydrolase [Elusimicrobium minutum Pei191]|uniref:Metal-dependent phosphohydrolase n=1 Tax=Elusimicrobium minutum (strain Pei191) TaxID=445932 RepID=B2KE42_ELUMP|nr:HD domain-containing protein [Elusimicrobium minutum]ACC98788.1 Metal-dependent phosphohydrolase [Elusimicrobium minutum Pei191]